MSDKKEPSKKAINKEFLDAQWKPGESGNPNGRPAIPEVIKKLRRLSKKEFAEIAEMVVRGSWKELEALALNGDESVLKVKIARGLIEEGYKTFDEIMNRLIGKVKEEIEVSTPKPTIVRMLNGQELIMGSKFEDEDEK